MNVSTSRAPAGAMRRTTPRSRRPVAQVWALISAILALVLVARPAWAAGTFRLKSTEVQEVSGGWHLYVTLELPKPPAIPHQSMKFVVTKTAEYERTLVDNRSEPVNNRVPLQNQTPIVESMDVDFSDGSGKIFKGTRFDFTLTRARGYVAGEYKVAVRTSDGVEIGSPQNLVLKGDNPVVDRRSMVFNAQDKKIQKVPGVEGEKKEAPKANEADFTPPSQEVTPAGTTEPFIPPEAYEKTPEEDIKVKRGGCGCAVPASNVPSWLTSFAVVGLAGLGFRRRNQRHHR